MTTTKSGLRVSRGGRRTVEQPDVGNSLPSANHSFFLFLSFSVSFLSFSSFYFFFSAFFPPYIRGSMQLLRTEVALSISNQNLLCRGLFSGQPFLFFVGWLVDSRRAFFPKVPTKVYSSQYMIAYHLVMKQPRLSSSLYRTALTSEAACTIPGIYISFHSAANLSSFTLRLARRL